MSIEIHVPENNIENIPDQYTSQSPDMTADTADSRVFFFNSKFLRFGTSDKVYASAIMFSFALLILLMVVMLLIAFTGNPSLSNAVSMLFSAFTSVSGYALGRGAVAELEKTPEIHTSHVQSDH